MPKVFIKGGNAVNLTKADFLASGGEGDVYVQGSRAYKLYHDPLKMIPVGKIADLSAIKVPYVIKPDHVLCDVSGGALGYDMTYVKDALSMCQLFPRAFREREGLTHDKVLLLIRKFQEGLSQIHKAGILVVDLNEMNLLIDKAFQDVFFIDADSFQTPHFPATAIMDSIRDPLHDYSHGKGRLESDWYSFGIVAFQMFTGIHPFRGKHPTIKGMPDRMKAGVSVLNKDVSVPSVVYPWNVIPPAYRSWFEAVFEKGLRVPPPSDLTGAVLIAAAIRQVITSGGIDLTDIYTIPGVIRAIQDSFGVGVVLSSDGIFVDQRRVGDMHDGALVSFTPKGNRPIVSWKERTGTLHLYDCQDRKEIPFGLSVDQSMATNGRLYVKVNEQILQVSFAEVASRIIASSMPVANCMMNATRLYEGVAVQNMLGVPYVTLFPKENETYTLAVKELAEYRVVDAKADANVLQIVAARRDGKYDRLILRFDFATQTYDLRKVEDISPSSLNFVVLDSGVVACLTEEDKIELYSARKGQANVKVVEDKALGGDMRLAKLGGRVVFSRGDGKITRLSVK